MKQLLPKTNPLNTSATQKPKITSQGELLRPSKNVQHSKNAKTPDLMRQMEFRAQKTTLDNKTDIYKTIPARIGNFPQKETLSSNQKPESDVLKKKQDSFILASQTGKLHAKKSFNDQKMEGKQDIHKTAVKGKLTSDTFEKKRQSSYVAIENYSSRNNSKMAKQSLHESLTFNSIKSVVLAAVDNQPFWEFKKVVSEEDILMEDPEPEPVFVKRLSSEFSLCNKYFLGNRLDLLGPVDESSHNSFCEITSQQSVTSFQDNKTDFIDSFRALPFSGLSNDQNLQFPSHALEKQAEIRQENVKNMNNFFTSQKKSENSSNDQKITVTLPKKTDIKTLNNNLPEPLAGLRPPQNIFNNEFESDLVSLYKPSPQSSVNSSTRKSDPEYHRFSTFQPKPAKEICAIEIYTRLPFKKLRTISETYSFVQFMKHSAGNIRTHFEDYIFSSTPQKLIQNNYQFDSSQQIGEPKLDSDTNPNLSSQSIKKTSLSSLEFICQKCRTPFSKNSEKIFLNKNSVEDFNFSEKRVGDSKSQVIKRTKLVLQNSGEFQSKKTTTHGSINPDLNKTNSGKLKLTISPIGISSLAVSPLIQEESLSSSGFFKLRTKLDQTDNLNLLSLSHSSFNTDSPQKNLLSIFKKMVVFDSKWEKVKETLFLQNPDIVSQLTCQLPDGAVGRVSWQSLAEFFAKFKIGLQKQQVAKLIMYVQGLLTFKNKPSAPINNFGFFNFLFTPKFLYSSSDLPSKSFQSQNLKEHAFSNNEIKGISSLFQILAHKIDYFAQLFKKLDSEKVKEIFFAVSKNGKTVKIEDIVNQISDNDEKIKIGDLGFVMAEFQVETSELTRQCFSDYFERRIWKA